MRRNFDARITEREHMAVIQPDLSLVILTCNRPRELELAVLSALSQDLLPGEIIVVDDACLDPEPIRKQVETAGIRFVYHRKDRPGIARSRNIGADLSHGDLVMYMDDDERMQPGYIHSILDLFRNDPREEILGAAGMRLPGPGRNSGRLDAVWVGLERLFLLRGRGHRILPSGFSNPDWTSFTEVSDVGFLSGTATYRRRVFGQHRFDEELERLGPYSYGEDLAFSYQVQRAGRCVVTPRAVVRHVRSGSGRPPTIVMARQLLHNQYYIYSCYFRPERAHPAAFAWAVTGKVIIEMLRFLTHPTRRRWDSLRGTVQGTVGICRLALTGGPSRRRLPGDAL